SAATVAPRARGSRACAIAFRAIAKAEGRRRSWTLIALCVTTTIADALVPSERRSLHGIARDCARGARATDRARQHDAALHPRFLRLFGRSAGRGFGRKRALRGIPARPLLAGAGACSPAPPIGGLPHRLRPAQRGFTHGCESRPQHGRILHRAETPPWGA